MNTETASQEQQQQQDCPICFEELTTASACHWPGCSHQFCLKCVVTQVLNESSHHYIRSTNDVPRILSNHLKCPLCRGCFCTDAVADNMTQANQVQNTPHQNTDVALQLMMQLLTPAAGEEDNNEPQQPININLNQQFDDAAVSPLVPIHTGSSGAPQQLSPSPQRLPRSERILFDSVPLTNDEVNLITTKMETVFPGFRFIHSAL